jgi:hypothetical protein
MTALERFQLSCRRRCLAQRLPRRNRRGYIPIVAAAVPRRSPGRLPRSTPAAVSLQMIQTAEAAWRRRNPGCVITCRIPEWFPWQYHRSHPGPIAKIGPVLSGTCHEGSALGRICRLPVALGCPPWHGHLARGFGSSPRTWARCPCHLRHRQSADAFPAPSCGSRE